MSASSSRKLNERQRRAIGLLVLGKSGREVARTLKVAPETVSRWRHEPAFEAALNVVVNDASDAARQRLRGLVADAVAVVEQVVRDPSTPLKVRIDTALRVLGTCGFESIGTGGGSESESDLEFERQRRRLLGV